MFERPPERRGRETRRHRLLELHRQQLAFAFDDDRILLVVRCPDHGLEIARHHEVLDLADAQVEAFSSRFGRRLHGRGRRLRAKSCHGRLRGFGGATEYERKTQTDRMFHGLLLLGIATRPAAPEFHGNGVRHRFRTKTASDPYNTSPMKIVILGAGQVGRTAAYHLSREESNEVTVVDTNEEVLRDLQDRLDIRTVAGNAAYPSVLEAAGCASADIVVALTSSDEVNMMACEVAYTLYRTRTKIARIRSSEYTKHPKLFADEALSVDVWISPEQLVTEYIAQLIKFPGALQVLDFADGRVRLVGIRARKGGLLVSQKLKALKEHHPNTEARVVAIYRNGRSIIPDGETVIEENDEVFFIAARDDIGKFMREIRKEEAPAKRVVIAGGGNIGLSLARMLEETNQVKLIERDPKRARRISEIL